MNFDQELTNHYKELFAFAMKLTHNREDAQDLVQDTIARAIESRAQFTTGTTLRPWLFTILRNRHFTNRRAARYRYTVAFDEAYMVPGPQEQYADELADTVAQLRALTQSQRDSILHKAMGYSTEERAAIEHLALGTVKSRLSRALAVMQQTPVDPSLRPAPGTALIALIEMMDKSVYGR